MLSVGSRVLIRVAPNQLVSRYNGRIGVVVWYNHKGHTHPITVAFKGKKYNFSPNELIPCTVKDYLCLCG